MKKGAIFLALFFCLCSCQRANVPCWQLDRIDNALPPSCLGRLSFPPENRFSGLELEITRGVCGLKMYLNAFCLCFPAHPTFPNCTPVRYCFEGNVYETSAHRFLGGQRLLLPQEVGDTISQALLAGHAVTFEVGRFSTTVSPRNFSTKYKKLNK